MTASTLKLLPFKSKLNSLIYAVLDRLNRIKECPTFFAFQQRHFLRKKQNEGGLLIKGLIVDECFFVVTVFVKSVNLDKTRFKWYLSLLSQNRCILTYYL